MLWLGTISSILAVFSVPMNLGTCLYFIRYARRTRVAARRPAALALTVLHAGLVMEAGIFLAAAADPAAPVYGAAAGVLMRSLLFAGSTFVAGMAFLNWSRGRR